MSPRRSIRHTSRTRRKLVWATVDTAVASAAASGFVNTDLLAALRVGGASVLGATVIRAHLTLTPLTVAAGDNFFVGLFVDNLDSVGIFTAVTGANVPSASSEKNLDWMMWEHRITSPGDNKYNYHAANNHVVWDVRSKRKVQELQQTLIHSWAPTGVAAGFNAQLQGRVLVALP